MYLSFFNWRHTARQLHGTIRHLRAENQFNDAAHGDPLKKAEAHDRQRLDEAMRLVGELTACALEHVNHRASSNKGAVRPIAGLLLAMRIELRVAADVDRQARRTFGRESPVYMGRVVADEVDAPRIRPYGRGPQLSLAKRYKPSDFPQHRVLYRTNVRGDEAVDVRPLFKPAAMYPSTGGNRRESRRIPPTRVTQVVSGGGGPGTGRRR